LNSLYAIAFFIGITINYFQDIGIFESAVFVVVPTLVQAVSRASVKYKNHHVNVLVRLLMVREDPIL
jgi:hypothetical protein